MQKMAPGADENGLVLYFLLTYSQISMTMQNFRIPLAHHLITVGNDWAPASAEDLAGHPAHPSV